MAKRKEKEEFVVAVDLQPKKLVSRVLRERAYIGNQWVRRGVEVLIPTADVPGFERNQLLAPLGAEATHELNGTPIIRTAAVEATEKR